MLGDGRGGCLSPYVAAIDLTWKPSASNWHSGRYLTQAPRLISITQPVKKGLLRSIWNVHAPEQSWSTVLRIFVYDPILRGRIGDRDARQGSRPCESVGTLMFSTRTFCPAISPDTDSAWVSSTPQHSPDSIICRAGTMEISNLREANHHCGGIGSSPVSARYCPMSHLRARRRIIRYERNTSR